MASSSKCPACGYHSFELEHEKPYQSRFKLVFVRCDYDEFSGPDFIRVHHEGGGPIRRRIRSLRADGGHGQQAAFHKCVAALAHIAPAGKNRGFKE